jgi:transcription antitermination factor NusG
LTALPDSEAPLPSIPSPSCDWSTLSWYALMTNIRCEERAVAGLRAKGYEVFYPVQRAWVRHRRIGGLARKWRQIERPLFPRYILLGFSGPQDWLSVRSTDGVERVVNVQGVPIRIPSWVVTEIYARMGEGEFNEDKRPKRRRNNLRRGDAVTVPGLDGMTGVVARDPKGTAERVLIELFSGKRVNVALDALEVV